MSKVSIIDITKSLKGMDFPAHRDDIIEHARENGAGDDVIAMMNDMPEDDYASMSDVMHAFGEANRAEGGR